MQNTITASTSRISELLEMSIRGLESMYDPEVGLFCHRLIKTSNGVVREGISRRYTIMTLLGLLRAQAAGLRPCVDIEAILDRLLNDTEWVDNLGDLGLLLWLCAVTSEKHLTRFYSMFPLTGALEAFPDARRGHTMELSWFLTGLAHARKAEHFALLDLLAKQTYDLLVVNQGEDGLFGHMAIWRSLTGLLRGRVGSFADQVYPIIAMAHFFLAFDHKEACERALRCAHAICRAQGPLGQWWWHYDCVSGKVVEPYPVYSVHQHGMGPMALLALEDACAADFQDSIRRGLRWIDGENELRQDLEDADLGLVWRCIQPIGHTTFLTKMKSLFQNGRTPESLHTLHECRPYELGWLLYAFAPSSRRKTPIK